MFCSGLTSFLLINHQTCFKDSINKRDVTKASIIYFENSYKVILREKERERERNFVALCKTTLQELNFHLMVLNVFDNMLAMSLFFYHFFSVHNKISTNKSRLSLIYFIKGKHNTTITN